MKLTKHSDDAELVSTAISEYTDEVGVRLCSAARLSASITYVAAEVGVPYRTLRYWLQRGENGDPRYSKFAADFHEARAVHEARYLSHMEEVAADTNPRSANARVRATEFLLQKLYPKQYSDQLFVSTMIERQADGFDLTALNQDQMREFLKMLKVIRAANEGAQDDAKRLAEKIKTGNEDRPKRSE